MVGEVEIVGRLPGVTGGESGCPSCAIALRENWSSERTEDDEGQMGQVESVMKTRASEQHSWTTEGAEGPRELATHAHYGSSSGAQTRPWERPKRQSRVGQGKQVTRGESDLARTSRLASARQVAGPVRFPRSTLWIP